MDHFEIMHNIVMTTTALIALKSLLVGDMFSFYDWFRYREEYMDFYHQKQDEIRNFKPKDK